MTDPTLGVWISEEGDVGAPDSRNLYRFVGDNPTNEVDPSGLFGEATTINFTFYGFSEEQQKELMDITVKAVEKLEKALAMLTDHWDELEDLATVKNVPKPFLDKTYETLRREILLPPLPSVNEGLVGSDPQCYDSARKKYIRVIKSILSQIRKGDYIVFKQVGKRTGGNETAAYIAYFLSPHGEKIRITPLFWDLTDSRKLSDMIRELGRREGFDETNTDNPLYDAQVWEDSIEYLARKHDELMAKNK